MGRASGRAHMRWTPEHDEAAEFLLNWALENTQPDVKNSHLSLALALINSNIRESIAAKHQAAPDGRKTIYGVRLAAVHPESGDYLAAGPWTYGLEGMEGVWKYVADNAWQLYEGMEAMPIELTEADLSERTNTARVAMSRRADGVAVVRVRFTWQKKFERKNIRRGADPNEVVATHWSPQPSQVNIWIAPTDAARAMDAAERAARHPLAYTE
jgi:hypothetical protein